MRPDIDAIEARIQEWQTSRETALTDADIADHTPMLITYVRTLEKLAARWASDWVVSTGCGAYCTESYACLGCHAQVFFDEGEPPTPQCQHDADCPVLVYQALISEGVPDGN